MASPVFINTIYCNNRTFPCQLEGGDTVMACCKTGLVSVGTLKCYFKKVVTL